MFGYIISKKQNMKKYLFLFICYFIYFQITAQNNNSVDSLKLSLSLAKSKQEKTFILHDLSLLYGKKRIPDSAIYYAKELLEFSKETNNKREEAWAIFFIADNSLINNPTQDKKKLEEALFLFKQVEDKEGETRVYSALGNFFYRSSKYDSCRLFLKKSIFLENQLYQQDSLKKHLTNNGYSYMIIANSYDKEGAFEQSILYTNKAKEIALNQNNEPLKLSSTLSIALNYQRLGNNKKATEYFLEAIQLAEKSKNQSYIATALGGLANLYVTEGKYEEAYELLIKSLEIAESENNKSDIAKRSNNLGRLEIMRGNFKDAVKILEKAVDNASQIGNLNLEALANQNLAVSLSEIGRLEEAERAIQKAILLHEKTNGFTFLSETYNDLHEIYIKKGDNISALKAYKKHVNLKDSLLNAENLAKIEELQIKYETVEKEREIEELSQKTKIQELEVKQRNLYLLALGVSAILLLFAIYFYYRQYSLKKNQELIRIQQHLLRSQINPHFFFNVLSSIRSFIIDDKSPKEVIVYLSKLAKLMRYTLEKSTEESIYLEEEINILEDYLAIQKMRFGEKLSYEIYYDDEIDTEEVKIPPMLVQPFIENALEHGILPQEEGGKIEIRFELETENQLTLKIIDNGIGIEETLSLKDNTENATEKHTSMALTITKERLKILNRNRQRLVSFAMEDLKHIGKKGTQITFSLPI